MSLFKSFLLPNFTEGKLNLPRSLYIRWTKLPDSINITEGDGRKCQTWSGCQVQCHSHWILVILDKQLNYLAYGKTWKRIQGNKKWFNRRLVMVLFKICKCQSWTLNKESESPCVSKRNASYTNLFQLGQHTTKRDVLPNV